MKSLLETMVDVYLCICKYYQKCTVVFGDVYRDVYSNDSNNRKDRERIPIPDVYLVLHGLDAERAL